MTREDAIKVLENRDVSIGVSARIGQDPEYWRKLRPALDMAISALRQQEHFREVTKKVEPLTLDEMRDMPCEPVYIVVGCASWWDIVSYAGIEYLYLKVEGSLPFRDYGKNWTAYRQKPEEDDHES